VILYNKKDQDTNNQEISYNYTYTNIAVTEKSATFIMKNHLILPYHTLQGEHGRRDNVELASKEKKLRLGDVLVR
jgi:hypothetical protein